MKTENPALNYDDARAIFFQPTLKDTDSWQVHAGDYLDEPDLVIVIEHATDEDGHDLRSAVAAQIVRALSGGGDSDALAAAFEQWKDDYDADPDAFASHPDFLATPPKSYGEAAARTLLRYLGGAS